jgi:ribosomal protein S18 acetylase RimI-like enzyme
MSASPLVTRRSGRSAAGPVIEALQAWASSNSYAADLHAGDVGWILRLDDEDLDGSLVTVHAGTDTPADLVAVAIVDGPVLRPAIRPDHLDERDVARALVDVASQTGAPAYVDAPAASALRTQLSAAGWTLDPDPWAALYKPLGRADASFVDRLTASLESADDIADRVAVQRAAFDRSTFTVARWEQMAAGPAYERRLDLLRRTPDGTPAAAATGWLARPGASAILEPAGTRPDLAGQGHGKAVCLAVMAELARLGAGGVTVHTPQSNEGAVGLYESCGLRIVDITYAMTGPGVQP